MSKKVTKIAQAKTLINHVAFLLDASGSMGGLSRVVPDVVNKILQEMRLAPHNTKVSLSLFDTVNSQMRYNTVAFDVDLIDFPAHWSYYASGGTPLIDATLKGLKDLQQVNDQAIADDVRRKKSKKKTLNEDHAFLVYVLTDGQELHSKNRSATLATEIANLSENFTTAILVPDAAGVHHAKLYGFPAGNITIWDATSKRGLEDAGQVMTQSYTGYMTARSSGQRSVRNLFTIDTAHLSRTEVRDNLKQINGVLLEVQQSSAIREFVEDKVGEYKKGNSFYELNKSEKVQSYKEIVIVSKKDGKKFGGDDARQLLGLPGYEVTVKPGDFGDWRIFIQSTSVNRKLLSGTSLFVKM